MIRTHKPVAWRPHRARSAIAMIALAVPAAASATNDLYSATAIHSYQTGSGEVVLTDQHLDQSTPQTAGIDGFSGAIASGYRGGLVSVNAELQPFVSNLLSDGLYDSRADASATYTFQVRGTPGVIVPIHVSGNASVGDIHASDIHGQPYQLKDGYPDLLDVPTNFSIGTLAQINISGALNTGVLSLGSYVISRLNYSLGSENALNPHGVGYDLDGTYGFLTNTDYTVSIRAAVDVAFVYASSQTLGGNQFGYVTAQADPTFTIADPAYSGFSIVGVPTAGPGPDATAAVPEPAAWAMMIGGFGLVGAARRRTRAHAASA